MSFSLAIIGAGWYGCHLALTFRNLGFKVTLFEKSRRVLHGASGNNQFRLHMGFHYARHHDTRNQSRDGYYRFLERYPHLSAAVERNIYAIPKNDSILDFKTYKSIMHSSGMQFSELQEIPEEIKNVEGAIITPERLLLISAARNYFHTELSQLLRLETNVTKIEEKSESVSVEGEDFDFLIDATWGHHTKPMIACIYEPTMLLYYETKDSLRSAYTFVDGPLYSVYPTEDSSIFTLSSVPHTPLGQYQEPLESINALNRVNSATVQAKRVAMEQQCRRNLPWFNDAFQFVGVQLSIKTKPIGASDDRSCHVERNGRRFVVMSGKIDNIFHAAERIISEISSEAPGLQGQSPPSLRQDIIDLKG
jgi:hypothetical protein